MLVLKKILLVVFPFMSVKCLPQSLNRSMSLLYFSSPSSSPFYEKCTPVVTYLTVTSWSTQTDLSQKVMEVQKLWYKTPQIWIHYTLNVSLRADDFRSEVDFMFLEIQTAWWPCFLWVMMHTEQFHFGYWWQVITSLNNWKNVFVPNNEVFTVLYRTFCSFYWSDWIGCIQLCIYIHTMMALLPILWENSLCLDDFTNWILHNNCLLKTVSEVLRIWRKLLKLQLLLD